MKQIQKRRTRRFAMVTAGLLVGSLINIAPAQAAVACSVVAAGPTTFKMAGNTPHSSCGPATDLVTVTGVGTLTFDLAGGAFKTTGGSVVKFALDLTGGTNDLVVDGSADNDSVDMGTNGINLDGRLAVEVFPKSPKTFGEQFDSYIVNGLTGSDFLTATGSSGTGDPMTEPVTLNGGDAKDRLFGGAAADTLNGDAGDDRLDGGDGADTENGGAGNDSFMQDTAANGGDSLNGGDGRDTVDYSRRESSVSVTPNALPDDGEATRTAPVGDWPLGGTAPIWVSSENDNVGSDMEWIQGGEGNDRLVGPTTDGALRIDGDDGDDWITGSNGKDRLFGRDGNDVIEGGANRDWITGGDGDDHEFGDAGNDIFVQERNANGADYIDGAAGKDLVNYASRRSSVDVSLGSTGGDDGATADGGEGDDVRNVEKAKGGRSNDTLDGNSVDSILQGGAGVDTITGGDGNDKLLGQAGDDIINGGGGNDRLYGGSGDDTLNGNAGNDKLYGGSGNDDLDGGGGTDFGNGGRGNDTCTALATKKSC